MILFWGRGAELDFERKVSGYMRKLMAVFFVVIMMCNCMAVKATEAKEIPFKITQLEDDPAADKPDYEVHINRAQNFTVVYAQDAMGLNLLIRPEEIIGHRLGAILFTRNIVIGS